MTTRAAEILADFMKGEPKPSKFGNRKTTVDGITFASGREARRYGTLKLMERAGEITDLKLQPRFPLTVNGKLVATYVGDFEFVTRAGVRVVEDSKGFRTPEFIIKSRLFEAIHGFPVREV